MVDRRSFMLQLIQGGMAGLIGKEALGSVGSSLDHLREIAVVVVHFRDGSVLLLSEDELQTLTQALDASGLRVDPKEW